jgi:hypothetical protein
MWPVNLLRDGGVRSGRLGRTLWVGLVGLMGLIPDGWRAAGNGRFGEWLLAHPKRFLFGLHSLLAQLFDVVGGPEIGQFLMHLITHTSPLTAEEQAMMKAVLGAEAMRYEEVRVAEGGLMDWVFARNGNLAFTTWRTVNFPRNGRHTRANRAILVHELAHVYQYERVGSRYLGEAIYMLIKTKRDCYNYGGAEGLGRDWAAGLRVKGYNREQQAQIVQDYFGCKENGQDVAAYEPFMAEIRTGEI